MKSKINKFLTLILAIVASIAITSCVQDDDYTIPSNLGEEENLGLQAILSGINAGTIDLVTIEEVKSMYDASSELPFQVDTDIVMKGYVSSSDQTGNFYKEIYIQDNYANPTSAIKVIINQTDLYNKFNKGREVYIRLNNLYIGEERVGNGVITVGADTETDQFGTTVTSLGLNQVNSKMFRDENTMNIEPLLINICELSDNHVGMFVSIDNMEFADNLNGKRYFDPLQDFDTKRTMQSCSVFGYSNFILETSSFSDFKNELLPAGNGVISGVITKDYFGEVLLMALNTTDDVSFSNTRCTLLDPVNFTETIIEDFSDASNNTDLDFPNWTNFSEEGSRVWREKVFSGNGYTEFSAYGSNDDVNIAWLVSPGIDLSGSSLNKIITFKTAQHHLESSENSLEVFISTDFDGSDVLSASWEPICANIANQSNDWYDFVNSGGTDVSSYSGTIYIAFKYTGSGNNTVLDGAYQIDDFAIQED